MNNKKEQNSAEPILENNIKRDLTVILSLSLILSIIIVAGIYFLMGML